MSKQIGSDDLVLLLAPCQKQGCLCSGALVVGIKRDGSPEPMMAVHGDSKDIERLRQAARLGATGARMPMYLVQYRRVAVLETVEPMAGGQG